MAAAAWLIAEELKALYDQREKKRLAQEEQKESGLLLQEAEDDFSTLQLLVKQDKSVADIPFFLDVQRAVVQKAVRALSKGRPQDPLFAAQMLEKYSSNQSLQFGFSSG